MKIEYSKTQTITYFKTNSDKFPTLIRTADDCGLLKWEMTYHTPRNGNCRLQITIPNVVDGLENYLFSSKVMCEVSPYLLLSEEMSKLLTVFENEKAI